MSDIRESGSCLVVGFKGLGIQLRTECSFREFRSDDQVSHLRVSESPPLDHLRVSESREFDHLLRSDCDGLCIRSQGVGFHGVGILSIRLRTVRITRYCIAAGSVVRLLAVGPQVSYRCWVSRQIAGCWTTGCRTAAGSVVRLLAVGPQGVVRLLAVGPQGVVRMLAVGPQGVVRLLAVGPQGVVPLMMMMWGLMSSDVGLTY